MLWWFESASSGAAPSGASLVRIPPGPFVPEHGPMSVTIPGAVDGWCTLHERFGSKPLASLWEPAVAAARDGYPIGESIAGVWNMFAPALPKYASPALLALLLPGGKGPVPGQLIRFPALAASKLTTSSPSTARGAAAGWLQA